MNSDPCLVQVLQSSMRALVAAVSPILEAVAAEPFLRLEIVVDEAAACLVMEPSQKILQVCDHHYPCTV